MKQRGTTLAQRDLWLRRTLLIGLPLVLAGTAWKTKQLQAPIIVNIPSPGLVRNGDGTFYVKQQRVSVFHKLMVRLQIEKQKHPFAASISVSQTTPWPKEIGIDLFFSQYLQWERKEQTLRYTSNDYGWTYSHVESSGINVLAKARLEEHPITLPAPLSNQLRKDGWTLTEHFLP